MFFSDGSLGMSIDGVVLRLLIADGRRWWHEWMDGYV